MFKVGDRVEWCFDGDFLTYNKSNDLHEHDFGTIVEIEDDEVCCSWGIGCYNAWVVISDIRLVENTPKAESSVRTAQVPVPVIQRLIAQNASEIKYFSYQEKLCKEALKRGTLELPVDVVVSHLKYIRKQLKKLVETQTALKRSLAGVSHV